jgi:catechol 2,3-dioxygenase-like lactoylglutathione lyase family enzyme
MAGPVHDSLVKFHASLTVTDLTRSVAFYRVLLGVEPAKVRGDYAKFELAEPPLILSLIRGKPGGNVNHVGLRVRNADELVEVQRRLEAAGIGTRREEGVECCYARQTKFWVSDPDRMLWEIYVFHEDIPERGDATIPIEALNPPVVVSKPRLIWSHRLGEAFPDKIPHESNTLHEVALEGSLNASPNAVHRDRLIPEALRALRPGGSIQIHGLAGDYPGNDEKLSLPGPAMAVEYVPTATEMVVELTQAGFVEVELETLSQTAYFVVAGVPMREFRIRATKPGHRSKAKTHHAVYRGPLAQVADDYGNVFRRGELTPLNVHDWQMLSKGEAGAAFVFFAPKVRDAACTDDDEPPTPVSGEKSPATSEPHKV